MTTRLPSKRVSATIAVASAAVAVASAAIAVKPATAAPVQSGTFTVTNGTGKALTLTATNGYELGFTNSPAASWAPGQTQTVGFNIVGGPSAWGTGLSETAAADAVYTSEDGATYRLNLRGDNATNNDGFYEGGYIFLDVVKRDASGAAEVPTYREQQQARSARVSFETVAGAPEPQAPWNLSWAWWDFFGSNSLPRATLS